MTEYEFTLILAGSPELSDDLCDALFAAGCDDGTPSSSCGVSRISFHRESNSLEAAIRSAIADVQRAGCKVERLEIDASAETMKV